MRTKMLITLLNLTCVLPLLLAANGAAQTFAFVSIDVPCSSAPPFNCPNGVAGRTALGGLNPAGDIVGVFTDGVGKQHGFVLKDGQFTIIDVPGSLVGVSGTLPTVARGINSAGDIVGSFNAPYDPPHSTTAAADSPEYCPAPPSDIRSAACVKGFLYHRGRFRVVLFPGHPGAIPGNITPDGSMYGCLHDYDTMASMFSAAWIRSDDHERAGEIAQNGNNEGRDNNDGLSQDEDNRFEYTSLAAGGGALSDSSQSYPNSMHGGATPDGRIVVGFYTDMMVMPNHVHGYVLQDGLLKTYDVPNSARTVIWDINPRLAMAGTYSDSHGQHGFLHLPDGSAPITVDAPNTAPFNAVGTVLQGINPAGVLTGQYTDTSGHTHGLVAIPVEQLTDRDKDDHEEHDLGDVRR